jgi:hypothetical protein
MKLKPIAANMTELCLSIPGMRGDTRILFSYETPVAAMNLSPEWHAKNGNGCIRTDKKWSNTTSRHISKWLQGGSAAAVDQSELDNLAAQ